jgi:hypothetical protein
LTSYFANAKNFPSHKRQKYDWENAILYGALSNRLPRNTALEDGMVEVEAVFGLPSSSTNKWRQKLRPIETQEVAAHWTRQDFVHPRDIIGIFLSQLC